ncbi:MAG: hypothetical protein BWY80_00589 [Firmicutes bacterium ADurb.Bin456]|nr:MAG: hypothetical protein BWY80_00589 [Firmicutes bacterium ADurb.Bin456]
MKRFMSILLAAILILTAAFPVLAAGVPVPGLTSKEEVVYGVLGADGSLQGVYVVNSFPGAAPGGQITDYGNYSAVSNMTSGEKLTQNGDMITINTTTDRFCYQGTLATRVLPWDIDMRYELDGKEIPAATLAGKSGALMIAISIRQNKAVNPAFCENYMLQASLTLDTEKFTNIASPSGTLISAGKNKMVTHTVLPGKEASITVTANVRNLTLPGVEIFAMPFSMFIEMPDTAGLSEDLTGLSQAVGALHDGVDKLSAGMAKTGAGAHQLTDGSADFAGGLAELTGSSGEMLRASGEINRALADIVRELKTGNEDLVTGNIAALPGGLRELARGLGEVAAGTGTVKNGYAAAYAALDPAIAAIPGADIDPAPLYAEVYGNAALTAALDQLMDYYAAAKGVKGTYRAVQEGFAAVAGGLDTMSGTTSAIAGSLAGIAGEMEKSLDSMDFTAAQMRQLQDGLSQVADNYGQFHTGLNVYMRGVGNLAAGYAGVDAGIKSLAGGIGALNSGAKDLQDGTGELNAAAAGLPGAVLAKIEEMAEQYDKSGFIPVSFVSNKNTNVSAVQFIMKTAPIDLPATRQAAAEMPKKLTFWQKLLKLFGLHR